MEKKYNVVAYSYVTASSQHATLSGARECAEDIEGGELSVMELDPQDKYPVTEVKIFDEDGKEVL